MPALHLADGWSFSFLGAVWERGSSAPRLVMGSVSRPEDGGPNRTGHAEILGSGRLWPLPGVRGGWFTRRVCGCGWGILPSVNL